MTYTVDVGRIKTGTPRWMADYGDRESLYPFPLRLDYAQFVAANIVAVTATAAAQNAETVTVTALTGDIPEGTVLYFTSTKIAILTKTALKGETVINVRPLPTALAGGEVYNYVPRVLYIPSGTFVGRTLAERDAGTLYGPWTSGDDEAFLIAFDITDMMDNTDAVAYRRGKVVRENYLPGWAALAGGTKTAIRAAYQCVVGAA